LLAHLLPLLLLPLPLMLLMLLLLLLLLPGQHVSCSHPHGQRPGLVSH
jgi:hypothetical protein